MGLRPILLSLLSTYAHAKDQGSVKSSMEKNMKKKAAIENKNKRKKKTTVLEGLTLLGGRISFVV